MKANVPERLYLPHDLSHPAGKRYLNLNKVSDDDIEYVRKDAFIEKACEWQRKELCNYFDAPREDFERFIEDFKKAMKDE